MLCFALHSLASKCNSDADFVLKNTRGQTFSWDYSMDRDSSGYKYFRQIGASNVGEAQKRLEDQGKRMLQVQPIGSIDAKVCPQGSCLRLDNRPDGHEEQRFEARFLILHPLPALSYALV
jgi:hypothetical protein